MPIKAEDNPLTQVDLNGCQELLRRDPVIMERIEMAEKLGIPLDDRRELARKNREAALDIIRIYFPEAPEAK